MQKVLNNKKRIAIIATSPLTVNAFLVHQIKSLSKIYSITVISNFKDISLSSELHNCVSQYSINFSRGMNLLRDISCLINLYFYLRKHQFDLIHSLTPKAGFLSAISGYLIKTKVRIHTFTGQVWVTRNGLTKLFLKFLDKIIGQLNTHILVDSPSQRDFLLDQGIIKAINSKVLFHGSISGVNLNRFKPAIAVRKKIRNDLCICQSELVLLFVGRLKNDKGILDLVKVFMRLKTVYPILRLILIGPDEENLINKIKKICLKDKDYIIFIPFSTNPQDYMTASDILILPSYREGFGSVIIEAGACGIPSIASNIYGLTDAVSHNETGLLFEAGDEQHLYESIERLIKNKELRITLGQNALKRSQNFFSEERLTRELVIFYNNLFTTN